MKINLFEDLEIWKISAQIAIDIFEVCKEKPLKNDFGTKDQIQRASFSVSNNINEGFEYDNNADFLDIYVMQKVQQESYGVRCLS